LFIFIGLVVDVRINIDIINNLINLYNKIEINKTLKSINDEKK